MTKREIEQKKNIKICDFFPTPENLNFSNPQIESISSLHIDCNLKYYETIKTLDVNGNISCVINGIDGRDGKKIQLDNKIEWDDQYLFENVENVPESNLVIGEEFDVVEYAIEQILLNIPMNLTKNYGKISIVGKNFKLLSEEEYQIELENQLDSRWDKLREISSKDKKIK